MPPPRWSGQNLGARQPERAEASVWRIGWYNMAYLVAVSVLFFLFPRELVGLFTDDPQVVAVGAEWLRILSYSFFVYGWWMVSGAGLQRRRRHGDADQDQRGVLLADPDPAVAGGWRCTWAGSRPACSGRVFVSETSVGLFTLWLFSRGRVEDRRRCSGAA